MVLLVILSAASARGGVSGIFDQLLQPGSSDFFSLVGLEPSHDASNGFVPSYPLESTLFMVSMYAVTASSRGASIVLLKLGALKQQDGDLVMSVWALLGSVAKFLVMSACLTNVLFSHSPERPLVINQPHFLKGTELGVTNEHFKLQLHFSFPFLPFSLLSSSACCLLKAFPLGLH